MEDYTIDKILRGCQAIALAKIWMTPSSPYIFRSNDNFVCIQQWEGDSDEGDDILVYNWYKWNYATCTIDYIGEEMPLM